MIQRTGPDTLEIDGVEVTYTAETETRTSTRNGASLSMGQVTEWEQDFEYEYVLAIETYPKVGTKLEREILEWLKESGTVPYGPEDMIEFGAHCLNREEKDAIEPLLFRTDWPQVNTTLLVNFLRLPDNHKKHLIDSMLERQPELFPETNYWKTRCELAEKLATSIPIDMDGFDASSAPHHRKEYQEFLKNNKQP